MNTLRLSSYVLLLLGVGLSLRAADAPPSQAAEPSRSTANYTNSWDQSGSVNFTPSYNSFPTYTPASSSHNYISSFGGNWYNPSMVRVYERMLQIYFPPEPVVFAQSLPIGPNIAQARSRNPVLAQMRSYLSDNFYPALSAYIHDESLSTKRLQKISDYRTARNILLSELRNRLDAIRQAEASARPALLASLASEQTPRIRELEATAEAIRKDLVGGGWFSSSVDWNDTRTWRLGDDTRYESYMDEYQVMRAAVYFQDGLTVEQRALLRELSMELLRRGDDPTADFGLDTNGPYFFFSPYSSRIRLPLVMPPELSQKISDYRNRKDALKQELRDTIYKQDRAWLESTRIKALTELAAKQAPELAQLETLAEDIRVGLSTCKYPDEPTQSILSPDLFAQTSAYLQSKVDLQRTLVSKMTEIRSQLPKDRIELVRQGDGYGIQIIASRSNSQATSAKRDELRAQLLDFNKAQSVRFTALAAEKERLRLKVLDLSSKSAVENNRTVEQMLSQYNHSFSKQEIWYRYREYRAAVLEPGLSPEQRRLLFGAAIESLMGDYLY